MTRSTHNTALPADGLARRQAMQSASWASAALATWPAAALAAANTPTLATSPATMTDTTTSDLAPQTMPVQLRINGRTHRLKLDTRTTLLDALREHLALPGTKKGCDHGQCGACTVLIDGRRANACLALAVMQDGSEITTIEGLASGDQLHPMQQAFLSHDGFQCGYCTSGQICSAIGMLNEARSGMPSHATADLGARSVALSDAEIRERMSGNLCRCSAYPNIVAAIRDVAGAQS